MKTKTFGAVAISLALAACGGGGGGGSSTAATGSGDNTSSSGSSGTTGLTGAQLLAAYTVPASIAADKQTSYATAFSNNDTSVTARCSVAANTSTTVYVTPNAVIYATTGVSDKAQALAADLTEQSIADVKTYFSQSASTVGFTGTKINVCVDDQLGTSTATGTGGESGMGSTNVLTLMSIDSSNFTTRYPNATSIYGANSYIQLYEHELTHVDIDASLYPFAGGFERWFNEGVAQMVVGNTLPAKATVLSELDSADLITASSSVSSTNFNVYDAYQALAQYVTQEGTVPNGVSSILTLISTLKTDAIASCKASSSGLVPSAAQLVDMPTGYYNSCYVGGGAVDARVTASFDTAWNSVMKDGDGTTALLLHTADGSNSLEATAHDRLAAYLQ